MIIFDGARVGGGGGGGGGLTKQGERGRFSRFSLKPPPMTYESSGTFYTFFFYFSRSNTYETHTSFNAVSRSKQMFNRQIERVFKYKSFKILLTFKIP